MSWELTGLRFPDDSKRLLSGGLWGHEIVMITLRKSDLVIVKSYSSFMFMLSFFFKCSSAVFDYYEILDGKFHIFVLTSYYFLKYSFQNNTKLNNCVGYKM